MPSTKSGRGRLKRDPIWAALERLRRGTATVDDLAFLDAHVANECRRLRESKAEPPAEPYRLPIYAFCNDEFRAVDE